MQDGQVEIEKANASSLEYAKSRAESRFLPEALVNGFLDETLSAESLTRDEQRKIDKALRTYTEAHIDKTTGLMKTYALSRVLTEDITQGVEQFKQKTQGVDMQEAAKAIQQDIPEEFDPQLTLILTSDKDDSQKRVEMLNLYLNGMFATRGLVSIDLIKLKSCNSYWTNRVPNRGAQDIVDSVGYEPLGLLMQAISASSQSSEYSRQFNEGRKFQLEKWQNPGESQEIDINQFKVRMQEYIDNNYTQQERDEIQDTLKKFRILPLRDGDKGDEFYVHVEKVSRNERGRLQLVTERELGRVTRLLNQLCIVSVGEYQQGEKQKKLDKAAELFRDNNPISPDDNLEVSIEVRAGSKPYLKTASIGRFIGATIRNQYTDNQELEKEQPAAFKAVKSEVDEVMERAKRSENVRMIFNALNPSGSRETRVRAALTLVMLFEQDRFPGDPAKFKEIINNDEFNQKRDAITWADAQGIYEAVEYRKSELQQTVSDPRKESR